MQIDFFDKKLLLILIIIWNTWFHQAADFSRNNYFVAYLIENLDFYINQQSNHLKITKQQITRLSNIWMN